MSGALRRTQGGHLVEWRQPDAPVDTESEDPEMVPVGRRVTFEIPDGFTATISLVPYTEPPSEPDEAAS